MSLAKKIDAAPLLPENFSRWFSSRGWTPRAHQLELLSRARDGRSIPDHQKRLGKLVRPAAIYVGPAPRSPESVEGWDLIAKGR